MVHSLFDYYRQKLMDREPFSDEEVEGLLKAYHAVYTGSTFEEYGNYMTNKGVLTYDLLAQMVQIHQTPTRVVDLACGDGPLAEILVQCFHDQVEILAVDMSEGELAAARKRLKGCKNVQFFLGMADKITQEANSVDYVLCHMAFMLMRPLDTVLKEMGRILKPGGTFAAIIPPSDASGNEKYDRCCKILHDIIQEYIPHYFHIKIGVEEVTYKKGLDELVAAAGLFMPPEYEDFTIIEKDSPLKHYESWSLHYAPPLLPPEGKEKLKRNFLKYLETIQDTEGMVTLEMPLRKISFTKK